MSIALRSPFWFKGREYKKLAPPKWLLDKYKQDGDVEFYIKYYIKNVLNKLDAKVVYEELGNNSVLLCWERSDEFCHRHIVADWFKDELGIVVTEWELG